MPGRRNIFLRLWDAVRHPEKWRAPDVVSEQPPPESAKRAPAKKAAPAKRVPAKKAAPPAPVRTRIIARNQLPAEWGPNEAAFWQDATKTNPTLAGDWRAQAYYDAALYTFSETEANRRAIMDEFFNYIQREYGVNFRNVFDWQGYREAYDTVAISHGGDFAGGGDGRS